MQSQMAGTEVSRRSSALQLAANRAFEHRQLYQDQLGNHRQLQVEGLLLDPLLHEARLHSLQALHIEASKMNGELQQAEKELHEARAALGSAHVNEHLAQRAYESSRQAVVDAANQQEQLSIQDAQLAGMNRHGV